MEAKKYRFVMEVPEHTQTRIDLLKKITGQPTAAIIREALDYYLRMVVRENKLYNAVLGFISGEEVHSHEEQKEQQQEKPQEQETKM